MGNASSTLSWETIQAAPPSSLLNPHEYAVIERAWNNRSILTYVDFCQHFLVKHDFSEPQKQKLWCLFSDGERVDMNKFARNILLLRRGDRDCLKRFFKDEFPDDLDLNECHWVSDECVFISLEDILSSVTHFDEQEIAAIERFFSEHIPKHMVNFEEFTRLLGASVNYSVAHGLFTLFDVNECGLFVYTEFVTGLSSICRGPESERIRTLGRIWDKGRKGYLSLDDIIQMYRDCEVPEAQRTLHSTGEERFSFEDFTIWTLKYEDLQQRLMKMLFTIGNVILGCPITTFEEICRYALDIVDAANPGDYDDWAIIPMDWWHGIAHAVKQGDPTMLPDASVNTLLFAQRVFDNFVVTYRRDLQWKVDFQAVPGQLFRAMYAFYNGKRSAILSTCRYTGRFSEFPATFQWPEDWYFPKPTSEYFFDIYCPVVAFMLLDSVNRAQTSSYKLYRVVQIHRKRSLVQVAKEFPSCKSDPISSFHRLRLHFIDGIKVSGLVEPDKTLVDYGCIENAVIIIEQKVDELDDWPEYVENMELPIYPNAPGKVVGLENLNSTCYLNSAIQCLSVTKCMHQLKSIEFWEALPEKPRPLTTEFRDIFLCLWRNNSLSISPNDLKTAFLEKTGFADGIEHDCHEALEAALNIMHEETAEPYEVEDIFNVNMDLLKPEEKAEICWQQHLSEGVSFVTNSFDGQLRSDLRCRNCDYLSACFEPFKTYNLSLQDHPELRFQYFTANERMTAITEHTAVILQTSTVKDFILRVAASLQVPCENLFIYTMVSLPSERATGQTINTHPQNFMMSAVLMVNEDVIIYRFPEPALEYLRKHPSIICHQRVLRDTRFGMVERMHRFVSIFSGLPFLVPFQHGVTTGTDLYKDVAAYVENVKQDVPRKRGKKQLNRAIHESDSEPGYPFYVTYIDSTTLWCSKCPWVKCCRGCIIPDDDTPVDLGTTPHISLIWKVMPYFLNVRYSIEQIRVNNSPVVPVASNNQNKTLSSIKSCMKTAAMPETLETQMTCQKCHHTGFFDKSISIYRLPDTMVINLKRFVCINDVWVKDKRLVNFPLDNFDLSPYMSEGRSADTLYDCIAFVVHIGDLNGGHYISYYRHQGCWYLVNDEDGTIVEEQDIVKLDACLLFYQKKEEPEEELSEEAE